MKIPFEQERKLSTSELPGVICHPTLTFSFAASPNIEFIRDLSAWIKSNNNNIDDDLETIRLAAILIKKVTIPDGTVFPLGTPDAISELINNTNYTFVKSLLTGWQAFIQTERLADLGKLRALSALSSGNASKKPQV